MVRLETTASRLGIVFSLREVVLIVKDLEIVK